MRRIAILLGLGLLAAAPRRALPDVVITTTGVTYEGKVVEETADLVVVETTFDGRKEIPRSTVKSVNKSEPPLREQLAFRTRTAADAKALLEVADWARSKGFKDEVAALHRRVIELEPQNAKARKALGHVKVGAKWMTPEEKEAAEQAALEAEMTAKGLVLHEGRWVTPQERDARAKGLMKDGDDWVTEEEFHRRRGETKVGGAWVRVGEAEGKARANHLSGAIGTTLTPYWAPHVDLITELKPTDAQALLEGTEKGVVAAIGLLAPDAGEKLRTVRVQVVAFDKATPYARFVELFDTEQRIKSIAGMESWSRQASRQKSFWWPDPVAVTSHYLFPNPVKNVVSSAVHNSAMILLTRHRYNYRFSSNWLQEGFAYWVEMASIGFSDSYTIGSRGADPGGDGALWTDSKKWREALRGAVAAGKDPSVSRLAQSGMDAFGLVELVKCWSVVDLLVQLDRKKFKAFVDGSKGRGVQEEDALKAAYDLDYAGLEARWRQFVGAGFKP